MDMTSADKGLFVTGYTGMICLIGSPVAHSLSPAMHNTSFEMLGLNLVYLAFDVNEKNFDEAVDGLIALGAVGWNATMPVKRMMCERCDTLSDAAALSGAVNTVVNEHGILHGYNTDGYGFMKSMDEAGVDAKGKKMVMYGSGGAASAILAQAALDGVSSIDIFVRRGSMSVVRLEAEIKRIHGKCGCEIRIFDLSDLEQMRRSLDEAVVLVNASGVGMKPQENSSLLPDASFLRPDLVVGDVIYHPAETVLLRTAREAGCRTFNGNHMVLHQGARAFRHWTGKEMPVEYIKNKFFN